MFVIWVIEDCPSSYQSVSPGMLLGDGDLLPSMRGGTDLRRGGTRPTRAGEGATAEEPTAQRGDSG